MKKNLIDLHTHSVLSKHAYSSLTENIEFACSKGLKVYGISEHQPDNKSVGAHKYAFKNCRRVTPKKIGDTNILIGIELNIISDGIDPCGVEVEDLDYCIASMHGYAYSEKTHTFADNTINYIKACNIPYVKIIGHLDYPSFPCDYEKVIIAAKENNKIIELNNASLNPNGSRVGAREIDKQILFYCAKHNVPILMGSDSHIKYSIGNVDRCIELLNELDFPEELVLNYNETLFCKYFDLKI